MQDKGDFVIPEEPETSAASSVAPSDETIRNIGQTHSEYPIIKVIPDSVIYIDGLPYLVNDYIGKGGVLVNFNDYVTAASGAVDISSWIPTCSVTLSFPNDLKYLLQAPAGQRILKSMSEIKIFSKGYYLTPEGDSVYHRVFWGVISNVTYADNKKTMEISMSCNGIMHLFDLMQINTAASVITAQATGGVVTPFVDKAYDMNALEIILQTFVSPLLRDVIDQTTVAANNEQMPQNIFERAYASKWNKHLINLQKGVRIFGLKQENVDKVTRFVVDDPANKEAGVTASTRIGAGINLQDEVDRGAVVDDARINTFLPNYRIGTIALLQSSISSRLARISEMVTAIGWEGYQDLDGSIVIKPPLYNLDCLLTARTGDNPFVINLAEVVGTETEMEDESQVRLTRLAVVGLMTETPLLEDPSITPKAAFYDPNLIRQFGLRQEPPKSMPFIANNAYALYAYAASELTKINKRWRTYNVTIPFRPELKLGFPIYVPHLDIYAYLENISWAYARGGQSTMTLSCTNVRYRELFAKEQTTETPGSTEGSTVKSSQWVYTAESNLEWVWCSAANAQPIDPQNRIKTSAKGIKGTEPIDPAAPSMNASPAQIRQYEMNVNRMKQVVETAASDTTNAWRVSGNSGKFTKAKPVDKEYYRIICHEAMPYTDGKGYIVLRPFPWGRFVKLEEALDWFTRAPDKRTGKLLAFEPKDDTSDPEAGDRLIFTSPTSAPQDSNIMAALGTPSLSTTDPTKGTAADTEVVSTLTKLQDFINDDTTCFILTYGQTDASTSTLPENPLNSADVGEGVQLTQAADPVAGDPEPPKNPLQRATDWVHGLTSSNEEGDLLQ